MYRSRQTQREAEFNLIQHNNAAVMKCGIDWIAGRPRKHMQRLTWQGLLCNIMQIT